MPERYELTTEIGRIEPIEDDDNDLKGFVDVIFRLKEPDRFSVVFGNVSVRVFFKDSTLPFDQLTAEARHIALDVLSRVSETAEPPAIDPELRQRWR